MQILPNLYLIPGVIANPFLIVEPDGLTLVDCGLPRNAEKILKFIAGLGFQPSDLRRILVTHADGDHVGSLAALHSTSRARLYASPPEAGAIRAGQQSRPLKLSAWQKPLFALLGLFFKIQPVAVDELLAGGQTLPVLGGLQALETPGHTPGHLSYFAPQAGVLFCGDSLRCTDGQVAVSSGMNTWDEAKALASARLQAALGAKIVCAGHGPVLHDPDWSGFLFA